MCSAQMHSASVYIYVPMYNSRCVHVCLDGSTDVFRPANCARLSCHPTARKNETEKTHDLITTVTPRTHSPGFLEQLREPKRLLLPRCIDVQFAGECELAGDADSYGSASTKRVTREPFASDCLQAAAVSAAGPPRHSTSKVPMLPKRVPEAVP